MSNSRTRTVRRVTNRWTVYDELPAAVRAALQEGPQQWDPVPFKRWLSAWRKANGKQSAIEHAVWLINLWHQREIYEARPWQPPKSRKRHVLSPRTVSAAIESRH